MCAVVRGLARLAPPASGCGSRGSIAFPACAGAAEEHHTPHRTRLSTSQVSQDRMPTRCLAWRAPGLAPPEAKWQLTRTQTDTCERAVKPGTSYRYAKNRQRRIRRKCWARDSTRGTVRTPPRGPGNVRQLAEGRNGDAENPADRIGESS